MSASVAVSGGAVVRQSYLATGSWYPRPHPRADCPRACHRLHRPPPQGKAVGERHSELTDGHWYRLDRDTATTGISAATEITNGDAGAGLQRRGHQLYDTSTPPRVCHHGKLTVRENVSHDNPVTYVFVATHAASGRKVMASFARRRSL